MKVDKQKPVRRWALWSPIYGFLLPLPGNTERLYTSRASAVAYRLSGRLSPTAGAGHQRGECGNAHHLCKMHRFSSCR